MSGYGGESFHSSNASQNNFPGTEQMLVLSSCYHITTWTSKLSLHTSSIILVPALGLPYADQGRGVPDISHCTRLDGSKYKHVCPSRGY